MATLDWPPTTTKQAMKQATKGPTTREERNAAALARDQRGRRAWENDGMARYARMFEARLEAQRETEYAEQFSKLCNFFWHLDNPRFPPDGFMHTSDVCRARALEVFELLGIEPRV